MVSVVVGLVFVWISVRMFRFDSVLWIILWWKSIGRFVWVMLILLVSILILRLMLVL